MLDGLGDFAKPYGVTKIDAGIWVLYNGDNYSHGGIVLTPGTYPDLGLPGLLDSSTSLRSLRPLPPGGDVALVLFQDTTFCGSSIALSRDCVDLGSVDSHYDLCRNPATSFGASSAISRWQNRVGRFSCTISGSANS